MVFSFRNTSAFIASLFLPITTYFSRTRVGIAVPETFSMNVLSPPVQRLQHYLRVRTDHAAPSYHEAITFLNQTTRTLLPRASFVTHEFVKGKPVAIVSIQGTDPALPAVMLNSHTDVVPAEQDKWLWDPFDARLIFAHREWRIYARGAQDMKGVGLQYLEALSALVANGWLPHRTVHVTYVPDEEIGGVDGMGAFVNSRAFKNMRIGVALDEGLPNEGPAFNVYYGERQTWWLTVKVTGSPGHGATFPETSATQLLHAIIDKAMRFRKLQFDKMNATGADLGDVLGINMAFLKAGQPNDKFAAGYAMNMIPTSAEVGFDIRVPPMMDPDELDDIIQSWLTCENGQLCPGVTYKWIIKVKNPSITSRVPAENPHIQSFLEGLSQAGISNRLKHGIFPAATDARYLRMANVPCFGFSPIEMTPNLLHKHNEYITMDGYLKGCKIYEKIIKEMAGPSQKHEDHQLDVFSSADSGTDGDTAKQDL
ncbi:unnamed protein product [Chondrus crispus]|uniref:N-acyl-aliphatic-L-amino acid amidohydrolase n=1 Tax=Chondrus crispus TaxID=2769 RepID=R7QLI5_CHOCR|nr:unnamed protein product [Chondrus crispus]CDF39362.1 unnamed protein product [Chondrus crispus]|eukprot:XP_005719273.1 unnamed protein product [Chondrus crispus]